MKCIFAKGFFILLFLCCVNESVSGEFFLINGVQVNDEYTFGVTDDERSKLSVSTKDLLTNLVVSSNQRLRIILAYRGQKNQNIILPTEDCRIEFEMYKNGVRLSRKAKDIEVNSKPPTSIKRWSDRNVINLLPVKGSTLIYSWIVLDDVFNIRKDEEYILQLKLRYYIQEDGKYVLTNSQSIRVRVAKNI